VTKRINMERKIRNMEKRIENTKRIRKTAHHQVLQALKRNAKMKRRKSS